MNFLNTLIIQIILNLNSFLKTKFSFADAKFYLKAFSVATIAFFISLVLCYFYIGGDQYAYIRTYNLMPSLSFLEAQEIYQSYLTSKEIVHFILIFIFSRITEKAVFISLFNSILVFYALVLFRSWGVNFLISASILLTNYYVYVLFVPAERLKFGVILFIMGLVFAKASKKSIFFSILSCFAHFQMVVLFASLIFKHCLSKLMILVNHYKLSWHLLIVTMLPIIGLIFYYDAIFHKVSVAMSNSNGMRGIIKPLIFLVGSLIYAKNKINITLMFSPLIVAAFFLGDSRVNMFCFFIFLYAALPIKNGFNIGILITLLYFGQKNLFFVNQIIKYGNGFYL